MEDTLNCRRNPTAAGDEAFSSRRRLCLILRKVAWVFMVLVSPHSKDLALKHKLNPLSPLIRLVCALALVLVGFSHKVPSFAAAPSPTELSAYVLPDGTIPVICFSGQDEDGGSSCQLYGTGCEACLISSAAMLPLPLDSDRNPIVIPLETLTPPSAPASRRHVFPPNAAPRAPPALRLA